MFLVRILLMALNSLQANFLRTVLATLGVVIGVAAVISAMAILEGAQRDVTKRFETIGADQLTVFPGQRKIGNVAIGTVDTLKYDDARALVAEGKYIRDAAPEVINGATLKYLSKNAYATILGTTPDYSDINNYKVASGRFLTDADIGGEARVVVLGHKVANDLFGRLNPVGGVIKVKGVGFRVVGVMEKKGTIGFRNVDSQAIIPITTASNRLFGIKSLSQITVRARDATKIAQATLDIKRILRSRHQIRPGANDDFSIFTQKAAQKNFGQVVRIFQVVLYSIAGISLVVGGIGIANIMLVSVTERTREIGVRMAVGARRWDILRQFLIEASIISFIGGALGVLLGYGMAEAIENITRVIKTVTTTDAITYALAMAVTTGVISGLYPAWKASRLDPVEALRWE